MRRRASVSWPRQRPHGDTSSSPHIKRCTEVHRGCLGRSRDIGGMLSVWKLAAGNKPERYYLEQVAHGHEDYYAGEGEAPGQWTGTASVALGVEGQVEDEGLTRLLQARNPSDGGQLRRPVSDGAVAGFDLTFRAPKSVSVRRVARG